MATQSLIQIQYSGSVLHAQRHFKGGPEGEEFIETAGQTYGVGDLLQVDTNGTVALASVNGSGQADGTIALQAKTAATGTTGANVHAPIIRADEQFLANIYHATPASAALTQAMIGTLRALIRVNGKWHVDVENAVEGAADALATVVIEGYPKLTPDGIVNAIGDIYAPVFVRFIPISYASDSVPVRRVLQYGT